MVHFLKDIRRVLDLLHDIGFSEDIFCFNFSERLFYSNRRAVPKSEIDLTGSSRANQDPSKYRNLLGKLVWEYLGQKSRELWEERREQILWWNVLLSSGIKNPPESWLRWVWHFVGQGRSEIAGTRELKRQRKRAWRSSPQARGVVLSPLGPRRGPDFHRTIIFVVKSKFDVLSLLDAQRWDEESLVSEGDGCYSIEIRYERDGIWINNMFLHCWRR